MAKTKKPKHIAVAGNIGAGKTTLTELLSKHYKWIPNFEDVDHNPYLMDFYEDNAGAYIYTDRSIYRPGQTVFYKAIFITKNKNTGEPMLMSKENLKGKLFGSVYKKLLKEM